MKEMSLQQVREFWTYLHDQEERKVEAFVNTPSGSSYRGEVRAEAETYRGLKEKFAEIIGQPITSAEDISRGLRRLQITDFLNYLAERANNLERGFEQARRTRQAALDGVDDLEYHRARIIYKEMENLWKSQIGAIENSRQRFMSLIQEES
jgi:hypothetical protein